MIKRINILGVVYEIEEVEVVNKCEPRRGEINYLTCKIKLDKNMPLTLKEQVLTHEILHAVFDLLGLDKLAEDEKRCRASQLPCTKCFLHRLFFLLRWSL